MKQLKQYKGYSMKRIFDFLVASIGLIFFSPLLSVICFLIWKQDWHSPFYIAPRVGRNHKIFKMVKLRSMRINADKSGVDSTSANDSRITKVGHFIRRYKLDEVMQLWNVVKGNMSLVGPRPNVEREVKLYTHEEDRLLSARPGITSLASIVFSDEGDILKDKHDPDIAYNQLIRPWKSRLDIIYIERQSIFLDIKLIWLTCLAIINKDLALKSIVRLLRKWNIDSQLITITERKTQLFPYPPPGATEIVTTR